MNICISRTQRGAYSETFIRNQIRGLGARANIFPIHSGRLPERDENGDLLFPRASWILHKIIKPVAGRNNYFSNTGLKQYLLRHQINVVLANYGFSAAHLLPACRSAGIPLVPHFHGYDASGIQVLKQYKHAYARLFAYAAAIVCVSTNMRNRLMMLGAPEEKIFNIPCGIDLARFTPSYTRQSAPLFLSVGRFTPKKAPQLTIHAFEKLWKQYPDACLVMIGGKNKLQEDCQHLVQQLGMAHAVSFPGTLPPEEVIGWMQRAHVFLQHSVTAPNGDMEGTPNSILEACACALPVISTLHGGIKDAVIHGNTGFLVPEGDVENMAGYMLKLIKAPELAEEMGRAGRRYMENNYALNDQINKLFNVLKLSASPET